ncbi:unnamed protein product [Pieris macdunnoughi]|uniref:RPA-interacting protein C-terminal domain-containing protein n=1 Tax=Pieris macdunnoughi TaxID=345717 RepID=A0A821MRD6_9NEOP|nr:unnamed protein product [Pieris macdunnoughi]
MQSLQASSPAMSPSYKNLKYKHCHSPVELKDKMRKDYKTKIQHCRDMLLNRFRESNVENELQCTLNELYKKTFNFTETLSLNEEENELLEEIKNELIQEELKWLNEEYEKSQMDNIDWSSYQVEDHVICPICQKNNLKLYDGLLKCDICHMEIRTQITSLTEIKSNIFKSMDKHTSECHTQFSIISEGDQSHIYLICDSCFDIQLIV